MLHLELFYIYLYPIPSIYAIFTCIQLMCIVFKQVDLPVMDAMGMFYVF